MTHSQTDMITPQDSTKSLVDTLISDTMWLDSKDGSAEADFCAVGVIFHFNLLVTSSQIKVSLSACGDGQLAYDDPGNGVTATKVIFFSPFKEVFLTCL